MIVNYTEEVKAANGYRQDYLDSVRRLISKKLEACAEDRVNRATFILNQPEAARKELIDLMGWPLTEEIRKPLSVERQLLKEENGVRLYRMKFEIFEGFYFYGTFFEYVDQKLPFVIPGVPQFITLSVFGLLVVALLSYLCDIKDSMYFLKSLKGEKNHE